MEPLVIANFSWHDEFPHWVSGQDRSQLAEIAEGDFLARSRVPAGFSWLQSFAAWRGASVESRGYVYDEPARFTLHGIDAIILRRRPAPRLVS